MHDQTSHDGVAKNVLLNRNAAESNLWLEAKAAPRMLSAEEPVTVRLSVSQTTVGKLGQQRIRRAPIKTALHMVGLLMILFSATMLPPTAVAWWYDGYHMVLPFAQALGTMLGLGLLCWLPVCRFKVDLRNRDGFIVVVAFWFLLSLLGALPFMLSDNPHMPLVDAVFETASGLTTTYYSLWSRYHAQSDYVLPGATKFSRRHGYRRAGSRSVADAGRRRDAALQGGNAGADEG
jgi:hypothetical protein